MNEKITKEVELKEGISVELRGALLKVKGPKGEVERSFNHPKIKFTYEEKKIKLLVEKGTKRDKKLVHTFFSHINNMLKGVDEPHLYKLKICSGHFPMNVSVSGRDFIVKNFLGESVPRKMLLPEGAKVKVESDIVTITSPNKEVAGDAASKIEKLCRITNRDRRIFQDGIFMIHKAGKDI
jgi:large subunit ribosomal protein L6